MIPRAQTRLLSRGPVQGYAGSRAARSRIDAARPEAV